MFCPDCGTWNRARAVRCMRCNAELPELSDAPRERPDEELSALRRLTGSRYRVIRRLGSGGMANVYYAEHQLLERPLVIKVLHAHLARDAEMRERWDVFNDIVREEQKRLREMHVECTGPWPPYDFVRMQFGA